MYYREEIINGVLMCKSTPNGEWRPVVSKIASIVNELAKLTDEERREVLSCFCRSCGSTDSRCQCWNDD